MSDGFLVQCVANFLTEQDIFDQDCYVAWSGGADSTALLLALHQLAARFQLRLVALHIDHCMQKDSGRWAAHCKAIAAQYNIPLKVCSVDVDLTHGLGPEAGARQVRWEALCKLAKDGYLFTAHHANDQAETLLQRLLRGGGLTSLGSIKAIAKRNDVYVCRPLLALSVSKCREFVRSLGCDWVEDPSNNDVRLARNYLRKNIIPVLEDYWPQTVKSIAQSAARLDQDYALLEYYVTAQRLGMSTSRWGVGAISRSELCGLVRSQQCAILRMWYKEKGMYVPSEHRLHEFLLQSVHAAVDKHPSLLTQQSALIASGAHIWLLDRRLPQLPEGYEGALLAQCVGPSFSISVQGESLREPLRVVGLRDVVRLSLCSSRQLKRLISKYEIPYPLRSSLPCLCYNNKLVAVGDIWLQTRFSASSLRLALKV